MMTLEQIVCHANNLTSLAEKALALRHEARTYRSLGKVQLADLLDQEAAEWEERAREMLAVAGRRTEGPTQIFTLPPAAASWDPSDRTRNCPCRPENGGSGVCGCILSGPKITC